LDHSGKAAVGFVAAHGDPLELLQLAEEILYEMPPFIDLVVDGEWCCALWALGDDDPGSAFI
jgi:hypothetical protein